MQLTTNNFLWALLGSTIIPMFLLLILLLLLILTVKRIEKKLGISLDLINKYTNLRLDQIYKTSSTKVKTLESLTEKDKETLSSWIKDSLIFVENNFVFIGNSHSKSDTTLFRNYLNYCKEHKVVAIPLENFKEELLQILNTLSKINHTISIVDKNEMISNLELKSSLSPKKKTTKENTPKKKATRVDDSNKTGLET